MHSTSPYLRLRRETDPASKLPDNIQKVVNPKFNIPTSESFRIVKNYMRPSKLVSFFIVYVIYCRMFLPVTPTRETGALMLFSFFISVRLLPLLQTSHR